MLNRFAVAVVFAAFFAMLAPSVGASVPVEAEVVEVEANAQWSQWNLYYVSTQAMGCYDDEGSTANPHCDHEVDGYVYNTAAVWACGLTGYFAPAGLIAAAYAIGCGMYFIG